MSARKPETPPRDLDTQSKALWKATIAHLKAQGTWSDADVQTLERYVRACERARIARTELKGKLTTIGSTGQLVQHPNVKTAREAERDAHLYATALLLTPAARRADAAPPAEEGAGFGDRF